MKKFLMLVPLIGLLAFFVFARPQKAEATRPVEDTVDNCTYNCPSIPFSWDTTTTGEGHYDYADKVLDVAGHWGSLQNGGCPGGHSSPTCLQTGSGSDKHHQDWVSDSFKCPDGYDSNPGHDNCRKFVAGSTTTTHHSVNVQYIKSSDPHRCHRPSDETLEHTYGMNDDARHNFKEANAEWLNATLVASEGYHIEDGRCVKNTETTPESTPTPVQPFVGTGVSDGKSDGRSDGRSSCPDCTKAPQVLGATTDGQVLGATTDFAGTGVADEIAMNIVGAIGGLSTAAGLVIAAKKRI
jgi:hypothetical protein